MRTFTRRDMDGEIGQPRSERFWDTATWIVSEAECLAGGRKTMRGFSWGLIYSTTKEELRHGVTPGEMRSQLDAFSRHVISNADLSMHQQEELAATFHQMVEDAIEGRLPSPDYKVQVRDWMTDRVWPPPL